MSLIYPLDRENYVDRVPEAQRPALYSQLDALIAKLLCKEITLQQYLDKGDELVKSYSTNLTPDS